MKRKSILFFFLLLTPLFSIAQTQQGYVKTKGRMVNGKHVPGQGLKGATLSIKGRATVLVNADNGSFSFPVTNQQFRLDSVKKKGYQLVDYEVCPKSYTYSPNPIYILMETPEQQLQDKLDAERKIRRNLQKQLQAKEDELEALKGSGKITVKDYQNSMQKLYSQQESNERLIEDMAQRYASLDYDQLDAFYRQVSYFIENGELTKADSMLNSRGDIGQQVNDIRQRGQVLHEKRETLQKAEAVQRGDIHEAAQRCYSYYETFMVQHLNDTAAYFLELRASLDTTNLEWMNDAGRFINDYLADYDRAFPYFQSILRNARQEYGENSDWVAVCYSNIASYYYDKGDYAQSASYNDKAFAMRVGLYGPNHPDVATSYNNKGCTLMKQEDYGNALINFNQALHILQRKYGENHPYVASCYDNIGENYSYQGDFAKALEYHSKALTIRQAILEPNHPEIAYSLNNIGCDCIDIGKYDMALECLNAALVIWTNVYGEKHPEVRKCRGNIGSTYLQMGIAQAEGGDHKAALENLKRALPILSEVYGDDYETVIQLKKTIQVMQSAIEQK